MHSEERTLVRKALASALGSAGPTDLFGPLKEIGFFDVLGEDDATAWMALFDLQGERAIASHALDFLTIGALGLDIERAAETAVLYPLFDDRTQPPARAVPGGVAVNGVALAGVERASHYLVGVADAGGVKLALVSTETVGLVRRPIHGFDPALGLSIVEGTVEVDGLTATDKWPAAMARAQHAIAQEINGASRRLLSMAVEHVSTREQFGAPIATFQAVKHRLADVHVWTTACRAALEESWGHDDPFVAEVAKALAGRTHAIAARHCQQVCGAIGFTSEFGMHRYVRRGSVLDALLSRSSSLQATIGAALVASGQAPRHGHLGDADQ